MASAKLRSQTTCVMWGFLCFTGPGSGLLLCFWGVASLTGLG